MSTAPAKTLRLILGDQLNHAHSWFQQTDDSVVYVLMEMRQETDYVRHHIQKVLGFFAAMRAFAEQLGAEGHRVHYLEIGDQQNRQHLGENLQWLAKHYQAEQIGYQLPDEYRLDEQLNEMSEFLGLPVEAVDTEHFLADRMAVQQQFEGKKTYLMESFYRKMRQRFQILLDGQGKPEGGKWNYDQDNRKAWRGKPAVPADERAPIDLSGLLEEIQAAGIETFGQVDAERFIWPTTREAGLQDLDVFVQDRLANFGDFQDALTTKEPFLFHSRLSFAINAKLLHPMEVIEAVVEAWKAEPERISLSATEGFVRQILGWREYMRGVYWAHMPEYAQENFFEHERPLPEWYWTGETNMRCLSHAIGQSLEHAYAHHIQRLMITGNFALLAGIHPDAVDAWYLGIYIDAIEWVEMPNTRGMSQFADGGLLATKPYISSANYVHKMGDYCKSCHYDRKAKTGDKACPFNSLYWQFLMRHEEKLSNNPRMGMMYRLLEKKSEEDREALRSQAESYLERLEEL
ncbi:MAG: cryptochrome/photolyase family protein [Bacteroidota bacterium]